MKTKTITTKIYPTPDQAQMLDSWLIVQRWVWNRSLRMLLDKRDFWHYDKAQFEANSGHFKESPDQHNFAPKCPLPWQYRCLKGDWVDGEWVDGKVEDGRKQGKDWYFAPYSVIRERKRGHQSCPLQRVDHPSAYGGQGNEIIEELIVPVTSKEKSKALEDGKTPTDWRLRTIESTLTSLMGKQRLDHWLAPWPDLLAEKDTMPSKFINNIVVKLMASWSAYGDGDRPTAKCPKFKPEMTTMTTKGMKITLEPGRVIMPKVLGSVKLPKSFADRWPSDASPIRTAWELKKEPSGWYLHLPLKVEESQAKPSKLTIGLDAGVRQRDGQIHILHDDNGRHIMMPSPLQRRIKKLRRLQRQASRQVKGSANQRKTYDKIGRLHEQIRRDRKAWHQKLSTYIVRTYDRIAVEELNLDGLGRKAKAKPKADGKGYEHNGQSRKRGLNQAFKDAGIGGLYTMIEKKAAAAGREFIRVPAPFTSQTCYECGTVTKLNRYHEKFKCVACGHEDHADTNAAKVIRAKAFPDVRMTLTPLDSGLQPDPLTRTETSKELRALHQTANAGSQAGIRKAMTGSDDSRTVVGVANDVGQSPRKGKTREPMAARPPARRKRRKNVARKSGVASAQSLAETPLQLCLWDAAPETG